MRKPKMNEIFVMMFALYMWFTLTVDPVLFQSTQGKRGSVYKTYIAMVGSQQTLAYISLAVAMLYALAMFMRNLSLIHIIHIIGLLYFLFITASFLLNYPNIAFGVLSMVALWLFTDLLKMIDVIEEQKKHRIYEKNNLIENEDNEC